MLPLVIKVVVIGSLHCAGSVLLYRGRVVNHLTLLKSDLLVIFVPALVALIAYGTVFWSSGFLRAKPGARIAGLLAFAIVLTCFSSWLFMVIAFNRYGT